MYLWIILRETVESLEKKNIDLQKFLDYLIAKNIPNAYQGFYLYRRQLRWKNAEMQKYKIQKFKNSKIENYLFYSYLIVSLYRYIRAYWIEKL